MSFVIKARQNRQTALQSVRARQNHIFAASFGAARRAGTSF